MRLSPILIALFIALPCPLLLAQPAAPHIEVTGTARAEAAPDLMIWRLMAISRNAALEAAAAEHAATVKKVLGFLQETGIPADGVQSSRMAFGENWTYSGGNHVMMGYIATTQICFRTSDLERYGTLWMGLARIPSVSVEDVAYDTTRRIELQNETRRKALLAAREKAADLAATLGAGLGSPWAITEYGNHQESVQYMSNPNINVPIPAEAAAQREGLAPGKIHIQIRVEVTFLLLVKG